ncbi:MAG: divalent metal cation transporter [Pirellulaceae bacterium]
MRSWPFRAVWFVVLLIGVSVAASGHKSPQETILIAQVANGLLLPLIAVFLLVAVNRGDLMGQYKNSLAANLAAAVVVLIVAGLGLNTILTQLGVYALFLGA